MDRERYAEHFNLLERTGIYSVINEIALTSCIKPHNKEHQLQLQLWL